MLGCSNLLDKVGTLTCKSNVSVFPRPSTELKDRKYELDYIETDHPFEIFHIENVFCLRFYDGAKYKSWSVGGFNKNKCEFHQTIEGDLLRNHGIRILLVTHTSLL